MNPKLKSKIGGVSLGAGIAVWGIWLFVPVLVQGHHRAWGMVAIGFLGLAVWFLWGSKGCLCAALFLSSTFWTLVYCKEKDWQLPSEKPPVLERGDSGGKWNSQTSTQLEAGLPGTDSSSTNNER